MGVPPGYLVDTVGDQDGTGIAGYRLGYGKGYFDMTLAELRRRSGVLAVGFAYEAQRSESLPRDDWDQPMDWIVTERKARRIR